MLFLVAGVSGCGESEAADAGRGGQGAGAEAPAVELQTAPVTAVTIPRTVEVTGTLQPEARTVVSAQAAGRVQEVLVDLGDRVEPGALLARIDPTDYELTVAQREAALMEALSDLGLSELPGDDFDVTNVATVRRSRLQAENAQARFRRATSLFEQEPPLISEQEYADLQTAADVAQQDYQVARLEAMSTLASARTRERELFIARRNLAQTELRAPQAGGPQTTYAVARRMAESGQLASQGQEMFDLVIDRPLRFRGAAPERFGSDVQQGQNMTLSVGGVSEEVAGTVSRISPVIDEASRTFELEVAVPNDDGLLRPGGFARANVRVGTTAAHRVPAAAVVSFAGTDRVFLVAEGKAQQRRVTVIQREGEEAVVSGGLSVNDRVAVSQTARLTDGTAVTSVTVARAAAGE
ncbi:MAG: efflux RND transporter periplasmic adaptor subunit [Phycisphaerae bacterium]